MIDNTTVPVKEYVTSANGLWGNYFSSLPYTIRAYGEENCDAVANI